MEGLIPMVYKAIRRNRTRSHYECLSAGAAQTFNAADLYVKKTPLSDNFKGSDPRTANYRRCSSVGEFSFQFEDAKAGDGEFKAVGGGGPNQLVRFRSHRRMFSCLSGAT